MNEITIAAIALNKTEADKNAYNALSENAQKVYNFFEALTKINPKSTWTLDLADCSERAGLTMQKFIAGATELRSKDYFMYLDSKTKQYVFGTSRMVF